MDCILTINVGSSSLKVALFQIDDKLSSIYSGQVDGLDSSNPKALLKWIQTHYPEANLRAIGHRVVHGGKIFSAPTRITAEVIKQLKSLILLAPLHMPEEINFIEAIFNENPALPQVACFDTSFHRTMPLIATLFAIPKKYTDEGIIRYGFHGLSYEYSVSQLLDNSIKRDRVVLAHLGSGASVCAVSKGRSIATSMGFTPLDGLMMGTRCGQIDPGVILFLMQAQGLSSDEVEAMLYNESGLLGVSCITSNMQQLLASDNSQARLAVELFSYRAALELGTMVTALKGIDTMVFTGGIGENSAIVRQMICDRIDWLGIDIDSTSNQQNRGVISKDSSRVEVHIIKADEELMIAKHTMNTILGTSGRT